MKKTSRRDFIKKAMSGTAVALSVGCFAGSLLFKNNRSLLPGISGSFPAAFLNISQKGAGEKEAKYYSRLDRRRVGCNLCYRRCIIAEGRRGFCRVRENRNGTLYSLVYGHPAGLQIDPIEMEPMYHMHPGHKNLCVYTASCNFRCKHCHNWHISQRSPEEINPRSLTPYEVVKTAKRQGCKSISHSINEPAVFFEYMFDIVKLAKAEGLLTLFHTNGYLSPDALRDILKHIDGVTLDLKAFNDEFYRDISSARLKPVLNTMKIISEENVHMEIVNLVIPTLNDDPDDLKQMCEWISEKLGDETPLHFNRFSPTYKLTNLPSTPVGTLENAASIAQQAGLKYVYIGNVPGHNSYSTYCPDCEKLLIHRTHYAVLRNKLKNGSCRSCGYKIRGIWQAS